MSARCQENVDTGVNLWGRRRPIPAKEGEGVEETLDRVAAVVAGVAAARECRTGHLYCNASGLTR